MIQLTTSDGVFLVRSDDIKAVEQVDEALGVDNPRYKSRIYIPGHVVLVHEPVGDIAELMLEDANENLQTRRPLGHILSATTIRSRWEKNSDGKWYQKHLY